MKILLIVLGAWLLITIIAVLMAISKEKKLNNCKELYKGMLLKDAVKLLGKDYKKEDSNKQSTYTWTGSEKSMSGIKKIILTAKDDKISDINIIKNSIK